MERVLELRNKRSKWQEESRTLRYKAIGQENKALSKRLNDILKRKSTRGSQLRKVRTRESFSRKTFTRNGTAGRFVSKQLLEAEINRQNRQLLSRLNSSRSSYDYGRQQKLKSRGEQIWKRNRAFSKKIVQQYHTLDSSESITKKGISSTKLTGKQIEPKAAKTYLKFLRECDTTIKVLPTTHENKFREKSKQKLISLAKSRETSGIYIDNSRLIRVFQGGKRINGASMIVSIYEPTKSGIMNQIESLLVCAFEQGSGTKTHRLTVTADDIIDSFSLDGLDDEMFQAMNRDYLYQKLVDKLLVFKLNGESRLLLAGPNDIGSRTCALLAEKRSLKRKAAGVQSKKSKFPSGNLAHETIKSSVQISHSKGKPFASSFPKLKPYGIETARTEKLACNKPYYLPLSTAKPDFNFEKCAIDDKSYNTGQQAFKEINHRIRGTTFSLKLQLDCLTGNFSVDLLKEGKIVEPNIDSELDKKFKHDITMKVAVHGWTADVLDGLVSSLDK